MPEAQLQKIIVKKNVEPIPAWKDLCSLDPQQFVEEIASRLALSYSIDFDSVIISDKIPDRSDRNKIWIKTSWPYAIGKVIAGQYWMDYGMSGYPANIPFQTKDNPLKEYVRKLGKDEAKSFGLFYADDDKATSRMDWYLFEPPEIKF